MKNKLKYFIGDTVIFGAASSINKAVSLLMFPILIASLSEEHYGLYDYFNVVVSFSVIAITFGFDSGLARFYYNSDDKDYREGLLTTVLLLHVVVYCIQLVLTYYVLQLFIDLNKTGLEFYLIQLNIFFQLFIGFFLNLFRWAKERLKFVFISIGLVLSLAIVFILLKYNATLDLAISLRALTAVNGFYFLLGVFLFNRQYSLKWTFIDLRKLILYSIPLGLIGVLSSLIIPFERSLILSKFSELELTKYTIAYKIGIVITLGINAFHSAWGPYVLSKDLSDKNELKFIDSIIKYFLLIFITLGIAISALSPYVIDYFTKVSMDGVYPLIFLISLVFVSRGLGWIFETTQAVYKSSKYIFYSTVIYSLSTIFFISMLIRPFGLLGVGLALLYGQLIKVVIDFYTSRKFVRLFSSDFRSLLYLVCVICSQTIMVFFINEKNWILNHVLMFSISLICFYFLFNHKIYFLKHEK